MGAFDGTIALAITHHIMVEVCFDGVSIIVL
jgi:hypothetical protein